MKRKRTPWPRWAKITRNLLIFLFLALTIWTQLGRPLPYKLAVRREARQSLMPEMDHHASISRGIGKDYIQVDWTEGAAMSSMYIQSGARLTYFYEPFTYCYQLTDGPNLLAFSWTATFFGGSDNPMETYAVYTAIFPPEDSVSAVLTLHNNSGTFTVPGQREDDYFIFYARPEPEEDGSRHMDSSWFYLDYFTYELEFFESNGEMICRTAG